MLNDMKVSALEDAARILAEAKAAEDDCRPAVVTAEMEVARLDECLRDKEAQRTAIADRRAAGKVSNSDSGDVLLIAMDTKDLVKVRARAVEIVDEAKAALTAAAAATTAAQANFERVQHRIEHATLHERAALLLGLAAKAHAAASDALARVDMRDQAEARHGLPQVAAHAQALLLAAGNNLKADRARMGGRVLWRPSPELQELLQFLDLNGPARQGGY